MPENLRTRIPLFTTFRSCATPYRMPVSITGEPSVYILYRRALSRCLTGTSVVHSNPKRTERIKTVKRELNGDPRKIGIQDQGYSPLETIHQVQSGNIFERISSLSKGEDQRHILEKVRGHSQEHAAFWLRWESNLTADQCKMIIFHKEGKSGHIWSWLWWLGHMFANLSLQKYASNGD